jgi:hypothetical protein
MKFCLFKITSIFVPLLTKKTKCMKKNQNMKLPLIFSMLILSTTLLFTSCVSTNKGFQSTPVLSKNVDLDPIKADIKVDESKKLKGESTSSYFLIFRVSGDNSIADGIRYSTDLSTSLWSRLNPLKILQASILQKVRGAAAYNALSTGDYDVLVHPNYVTTVKNYLIYKKYSVKVDGYGAKYTNFRTEKQKVIITNNSKEYIFDDK